MSGDQPLVEAFRNGEDIHTRTAAEVIGVPPLMVTAEARREAKAVNFGIVYGISAFGLAAQLGIARGEAEKYIRNYFARYSGVRRFIDRTIAEVRQSGVTRTLFGRERPMRTSCRCRSWWTPVWESTGETPSNRAEVLLHV
jgi:DNA polymerase I